MADSGLASWAGDKLAGGAVSALGAEAMTAGLAAAGVSLPGDSSSQLDALKAELDHIVGMLSEVQNEIHDLAGLVTRLVQDSTFDTGVRMIQPQVDSVFSLSKRLASLARNSLGSAPQSDRTEERQDVQRSIASAHVDNQRTIHNAVAGSQTTTTLYELFANQLKAVHRFLTYRDSDAVQRFINYYQNAQYLENLLIQAYYKAVGDADGVASAEEIYQQNMVDEKRFHVLPIPYGVAWDQKSRIAMYAETCEYVTWDESNRLSSTTTQDRLSKANPPFNQPIWQLPSAAHLLSTQRAGEAGFLGHGPDAAWGTHLPHIPVGVFSDYDPADGTPAEWLMKNGVPWNLVGLRFWTTDAPDEIIGLRPPGIHLYVDISNHETLYGYHVGYPGTPGHTLRIIHAVSGYFPLGTEAEKSGA
ncbi:MAG TPA: hypothetical protein VGC72_10715 [Candidatus Elarobacter sp.]|jgi:hypothetical protein